MSVDFNTAESKNNLKKKEIRGNKRTSVNNKKVAIQVGRRSDS